MSKVKCQRMKGKRLVTSFGLLTFDLNGVVELPEEKVKEFLCIKGFELVEEIASNSGVESPENSSTEDLSKDEKDIQKNSERASEDNSKENSDEKLPDFSKMNIPQLKKYAKEHDIDLAGANKKDEIIPILTGSKE